MRKPGLLFFFFLASKDILRGSIKRRGGVSYGRKSIVGLPIYSFWIAISIRGGLRSIPKLEN